MTHFMCEKAIIVTFYVLQSCVSPYEQRNPATSYHAPQLLSPQSWILTQLYNESEDDVIREVDVIQVGEMQWVRDG